METDYILPERNKYANKKKLNKIKNKNKKKKIIRK
jgi:hypothetical protein